MRGILSLVLIVFLASEGFSQIASVQDGAWNDPDTWDCACVPVVADGTITLFHAVNVSSSTSADQVLVDIGGALTVDGGVTFTIAAGSGNDLELYNDGIDYGFLTVNGTLVVSDNAIVVGADQGNTVFSSGSVYRHLYTATEGSIPIANWSTSSTVELNGYTASVANITATAGGNWNQSFGNLHFNSPLATNRVFDFAGLLTSVGGELRVIATGTGRIQLSTTQGPTIDIGTDLSILGTSRIVVNTTGSATLNIDRDFIFNSTLATGSNTNSTGTTVINVTRDFLMSASGGQLILASGAGAGGGTFNIGRNFSLTAGTLTETSSSTGAGTLNFTSGSHTFANSGTISNTINYIVANSGTLDLGASAVTGTGAFTLSNSSRLIVGSVDVNGAIQNSTTAGNIRTTVLSRTYSASSTIEYSGAGAQAIGNGFPSNVNLEIDNSAGVTNNNVGVTNVIGNLTLTSGALIIGSSNTLNVQSNFIVTSGTIGGSTTSNLTFSNSGSLGTLTFASGSEFLNNLTLTRSGTVVLGSSLTISGAADLTNGSLNFSGRTLTLDGTFTSSSGLLICSAASTLNIGGSGAFGTLAFSPGSIIGTLTFNRSGTGTASINSSLTISTAFNLTNGDFTNTSGLQMGNGSTLTRNSTAQLLANAPVNLPASQFYHVVYTGGTVTTGLELSSTSDDMLGNLTISGGPVTLNADIRINGNVAMASSTFSANGRNIQLTSTNGTWTKTSGTFSGGAGTLTISNAGNNASYTVIASSTPNYTNISIPLGNTFTLPSISTNIGGNLAVSGTLAHSNGTVIFSGTTAISGTSPVTLRNVTISGALTASATTSLSISGNLINNGTFAHNNGTVVFNGTTAISGSTTTSLFHTTISGTLTAPAVLNIAGNFTNSSGTFNNNNGRVVFNGTVAAQSVSGSQMTFFDIDVSNPTGVNINNTSRLNGTFNLISSGVFDADGTGSGVFIVSSSSQIAGGRISALATPTNFTGAVTVERFIHSQTGGDYRYLGIPITNGNVSMLKNSIFVTGNFSDRSTNADNSNIVDSGNLNPSVFTWNNATQAFVGVSGGGGTTASTSLNNALGYSAYNFNNGSVTASFRGTIGKGNVAVAISNVNGNFNLVPNPYPSQIDWDNVVKTNVTNAMYLRVTNNVFSSYVGGIATNPPFGGWTGEVATGQSFWAVSNGSGASLGLREADKTSSAFEFLRKQAPDGYFRIALSSDKGERDETIVRFVDGATDELDEAYDAHKMRNGNHISPVLGLSQYLNISTYLDTAPGEFAVNTMDLLDAVKIVRLKVYDVSPGPHAITFTDMSMFTMGYPVVLVDNFLNKEFLATDAAAYEFSITENPMSFDEGRFHLRINGVGVVTGDHSNRDMVAYPNPVKDVLYIDLTDEQQSSLRGIQLIDALGNQVASSDTNRELLAPGRKEISMSNRSAGMYILLVKYGESVKTIKVVKQ